MGRIRGLMLKRNGRWLIIVVAIVLLGAEGGTGYWYGTSKKGNERNLSVVQAAHADEMHPHADKVKNPDGSWKYTNSLIHETSPYLLLHAHNPVNWYSWGPEALERAKEEDKPIFLSVGYSTCYWCHVMERQVFSDPAIADMMNRWFINIKVDREERPDLDEIYMTATHLTTGSGGWPNSVFLTPDLKPFFAGTYFPPEDKYGRPGFPRVLQGLHDVWKSRRSDVEEQAEHIAENIVRIKENRGGTADATVLDQSLADGAIRQLKSGYDAEYGGFSGAPKFPPSQDLELLMGEYERTGDEQLLEMVTHTMEMMARGGMHDHLGGGFHRYSTDGKWWVPHFEKMLYNQAQLSKAYLRAYKMTGEEQFRHTAEDIFRFVEQVMTAPEGGFYSAFDSETDGIEGKYYLWTEQEVRDVLRKESDLFLKVYALAPMSEGEEKVIFMSRSLQETAKTLGTSEEALRESLKPLKEKLFQTRRERKHPLLDTKILTAWNGLMIDAYAYGYEVLRKKAYLEASQKAAGFVLEHLGDGEGNLRRTYKDGEVKYDGYQEDYAFLIQGLLGLYRASGEKTHLDRAMTLADRMIEHFWDEAGGGFYFTTGKESLIARSKNPYDSAIPSGNSMAAHVFLTLAREKGRKDYLDKGRRTLQAFAGSLKENPGAFKYMALAVQRYLEMEKGPVSPVASLFSGYEGSGKEASFSSLPENKNLVQSEAFVSVDRLVPGKAFQIALRVNVSEGWHVNANPASLDFLVPTTLNASSDLPLEVVSVDYPPGKELNFRFAEQPLTVYEGEVVIRATLRLDASAKPTDKEMLYLNLEYQACNDRECLAPTKLELSIEVSVLQNGGLHG